MKVVFTGGGTGGHIYPIIAVTREIAKTYSSRGGKKLEFFYVGPKDKSINILLGQEGIKIKTILAGKVRRYFGIRALVENLIDPFKTIAGVFQAFFHLFLLAPDLIFSKGGYGSFPVVLAGKFLRIPIFLHESDAIIGLANKTLGRFSDGIFTSFPETENANASKMVSVGNPVRTELLDVEVGDARRLFELNSRKPVVFIMGGSQGSQRINNLVLNILPHLLKNFEVIHQTGKRNLREVGAEAKTVMTKETEKLYHPVPFLAEKELKHAYKIAEIIVSRAGSGSIFEIAAVAKPSILIPLPESAQGHQLKNAYAYAKSKACIVIEEENLTPRFFLATLKQIISTPKKIEEMKKKAQEFSRLRAGEIIANYIIDYLIQ